MEERCVCCGNVIPEGRQVCMYCEELEIDQQRKPQSAKRKYHKYKWISDIKHVLVEKYVLRTP